MVCKSCMVVLGCKVRGRVAFAPPVFWLRLVFRETKLAAALGFNHSAEFGGDG